jgi:hypothetical protein
MLGISPVSYNNHSKAPSFGYSKQDVDNDINFYKEQVEELDQFINENYIPDKMKKPFKFFRTIANGAIDGLAVFGSTLMLAGFIKKSGAKIGANKYYNSAVNIAKSAIEKAPKGLKFIGEKIVKGFDKLLKSPIYEKFASSKWGKRLIVDASILAVKGEDAIKVAMKPVKKLQEPIQNKIIKPIKNIDSDKAVKGTATVLGIGSGVTGAYETSMRNDEKAEVEEPDFENYEEEYRESA